MPRPAPRVAPATTATRPHSARPSGIQFITRVSRESGCGYPHSAFRRILARVTPLQRYIAEEIATDHVDGLLSRREALRRLGLLGVGAAAASALIAACSDNKKPTSDAPATSTGAVTASQPATASPQAPGSDTA